MFAGFFFFVLGLVYFLLRCSGALFQAYLHHSELAFAKILLKFALFKYYYPQNLVLCRRNPITYMWKQEFIVSLTEI